MTSLRTTVSTSAWIVVILAGARVFAQHPGEHYPAAPPVAGYAVPYAGEAPPTGMDQIRDYPHPGPHWAATHGYPNYDFQDYHYGPWFRSNAWGRTRIERHGISEPFRPRGLGNLFARPKTTHRMDYSRPYIADTNTSYGPSYYVRQGNPNVGVRTFDGKHVQMRSRNQEEAILDQLGLDD